MRESGGEEEPSEEYLDGNERERERERERKLVNKRL